MDEGCNAIVCGEARITNARAKFQKFGYNVADLQPDEKAFRGLAGDTVTMEKRRFPFECCSKAAGSHGSTHREQQDFIVVVATCTSSIKL